MSTKTCYKHQKIKAVATCENCGRDICAKDLRVFMQTEPEIKEMKLCPSCNATLDASERHAVFMTFSIAFVLIFGTLLIALFFGGGLKNF